MKYGKPSKFRVETSGFPPEAPTDPYERAQRIRFLKSWFTPNKGEHQIRHYGWYSNKSRGMRKGKKQTANADAKKEPLTEYQRKWKMTWAALIKCVYEVDPLKCPKCGEEMTIVSFIEAKTQADVIKRILKHCGLWKEKEPPPPPPKTDKPPIEYDEPQYDYSFFDNVCA